MKAFIKYIFRHLTAFTVFIFILFLCNGILFVLTFRNVVDRDYSGLSPASMLEKTAAFSTADGITKEGRKLLTDHQIWAVYLSPEGNLLWSVDRPDSVKTQYTVPETALFSRGYLEDYPVFVRSDEQGLLVLGYPKDSYVKLPGNYFSLRAIRLLPAFFAGILALDLVLLFLFYFLSRQKILREVGPILSSLESLSSSDASLSGNVSPGGFSPLPEDGELGEIAGSINRVRLALGRQNEARANWISGISHDIRTPLSMIMGYAERIASDRKANEAISAQAEIIKKNSAVIKALIQDLNLVSQLEYEMQPLKKESVRLSALLRSYTAELLNTGIPDSFLVEIEIAPDAEALRLSCDSRLIRRAIGNLVQNSIAHNPQGCLITLSLACQGSLAVIAVADTGKGFSPEKLRELEEMPHYLNSTDQSLNLRHGLGLLLIRRITEAHGGSMEIENRNGVAVTLKFDTATKPSTRSPEDARIQDC